MNLLDKPAEIKAAIAVMNPVARTAAQGLASFLLNNPALLQDEEKLRTTFTEHCLFAMKQHGWNLEDEGRIARFAEDHGSAVMNVAVSIVMYSVRAADRQRKWGWVGKAAAFAVGATIATFFG